MGWLFWLLAFHLVSPWVLWIIYAAIMNLKRVRDAAGLNTAQKVFGYPALFLGYVLDAYVNLVWASILFGSLPREWTLSERLWRLSNEGTGRQKRWALAVRQALLDALDPSGIHRG